MRRVAGWGIAWLVAAALAAVVGVVAVSTVGAGLRGRGPIGDNEAIREAARNETFAGPGGAASLPAGERRALGGEFGVFVVECQGPYAVGVEARPDTASGWRIVSIDRGPDDDVDAVFSNRLRSSEIEVFCDQGVPTVAEIEFDELTPDNRPRADSSS
jgi:hypothetical protein